MKLLRSIYQVSKRRMLVSILLFVLAMIFLLPMMSKAIGNIQTPDTEFWYNSVKLIEMKEGYTEENINEYITTRFTYDLIWPLIYGFFMVSTIGYMTRSMKQSKQLTAVYALPIVAVLFDLLENTMSSLFFAGKLMGVTTMIAPLASGMKWIVIFIVFLVQGILFIINVVQWMKSKQ